MYRITSKSLLGDNEIFDLNNFNEPFFFNEKKKYKLFEKNKFKNNFFELESKKHNEKNLLIISGPARSGNHLILSLLDHHSQINNPPGEDSFLLNIFNLANINEEQIIKQLKSGNINFYSKLSSNYSDEFLLYNKWKDVFDNRNILEKNINNLNKMNTIWAGTQKKNEKFFYDFESYLPKINYLNFLEYMKTNSNKFKKIKNIFDFIFLYLESINQFKSYEKNVKYSYCLFGSGLRRESHFLLNSKINTKLICPIRSFEGMYQSYCKSQNNKLIINQRLLNEYWEHWRHKVVDYLLLKKYFPNDVILLSFERLVNNPQNSINILLKKLNLKKETKSPTATIFGEKVKGNSSFKNFNKPGKIYKKINEKKIFNNYVKLPKEYSTINDLINKYAIN